MLINTSARDTVCANKRGRERKRERVRERRKDIEWERDSVCVREREEGEREKEKKESGRERNVGKRGIETGGLRLTLPGELAYFTNYFRL